jgi:hypothetical protein
MDPISVRASRTFTGNAPISLVGLAKLENRPFPVSVREMATVETREWRGHGTAGDVSVIYVVTMYSTGWWYLTADFRDDGDISGDAYLLEFKIDGQGRGIWVDGQLDHGATMRRTERGNDPWLRDNWAHVRGIDLRGELSATPDLSTLIYAIVAPLIIIGAIAFVVSPGTRAQACPDQLPDDHSPCIQFTKDPGQ